MFYSGGARKKNALREILKFDPEKKDEPPLIDSADEEDGYSERNGGVESQYDSESSYSDAEDDFSYILKDKLRKRVADTGPDTGPDTDIDHSTNPDNNDYVVSVGTDNTTGKHYHYTFIEEELQYDVEEFVDTHPDIKTYQLVIYRINTSSSLPFLEFLFYYDTSSNRDKGCCFPEVRHESKHNIRKTTDGIMKQLFVGKYRFKGFLHDAITGECLIFYEKYFVNDNKNEENAFISLQKSYHWFWVCTTEIMYNQKYLTIPINTSAIEFFIAYPTAGILQATIVSNNLMNRFKNVNIEAPTILYYGSDICYAKNIAIYGLKRESIISRYGPFYYFTTLEQSFYWACYIRQNEGRMNRRETINGGISRYAVFTKSMKTVFIDDDYNEENVKKFIDRKTLFNTKANSVHQTQESYRANKLFDSIYSFDYDWTNDYDTIYNGYYKIDNKNILRPIWSVCDHRNFKLLSYYEVDVEKCPEKYDPAYLDYTFM